MHFFCTTSPRGRLCERVEEVDCCMPGGSKGVFCVGSLFSVYERPPNLSPSGTPGRWVVINTGGDLRGHLRGLLHDLYMSVGGELLLIKHLGPQTALWFGLAKWRLATAESSCDFEQLPSKVFFNRHRFLNVLCAYKFVYSLMAPYSIIRDYWLLLLLVGTRLRRSDSYLSGVFNCCGAVHETSFKNHRCYMRQIKSHWSDVRSISSNFSGRPLKPFPDYISVTRLCC